ncbi:FAD/NAD(P)-binding domain-containing protein [Mycena floridula]|nr:FAD/NAD(P)-binding domain-containing protein [Mycena floridula]
MEPPLKVIVVGAGIGGLAAAIALRQQGHHVEIFEASKVQEEIGAGIGVPPNAVRVLKYLGCNLDALKCVLYEGVSTFMFDGKEGLPQTLNDINERFGESWYLCHRVDLHNTLKTLAVSKDHEGPPATLHLGRRVTSCDPIQGSITIDSTSILQKADLIIGADGIRSTCRDWVTSEKVHVPPSGIAAYRWMVDSQLVQEYQELDWVISKGPSGPRIVTAKDSRILFLYPCRGGTLINVLAIHKDSIDQDSSDWNQPATQEEVLNLFKDFHPKFKLFLSLAKDIRLWQMRSVPILDAWTQGNLALLGDSAHATLPTFGQGFAMALEDAVTLGVLFPQGSKAEDVPSRLKAYEHLRKERAEYVLTQSRDQMVIPELQGIFYRSPKMQKELMAYDARSTAEKFCMYQA